MQIAERCVAFIHYTLKNAAGEVIDASEVNAPMPYLHGAGNIVPGLEKALAGRQAGDKLAVTVAPAEGYGERLPALVQNVPRRAFQGIRDIRPGMRFSADTAHGPVPVRVTKVQGDLVTVDGNHELAGETLHFEVEVAEVREATEEELAHGHVHGPGGHHDH